MAVKKVKVPLETWETWTECCTTLPVSPTLSKAWLRFGSPDKNQQGLRLPEATPGSLLRNFEKDKILDDLGWFGTAFVLSEFCLDFFLLFLRAQRTSEFSGLHLGFAWEARQKTHSIKHIPIRFRSDGGLPFGNQRWQWKNHTISLGISQLATFDDNAGYTIGKIDSIFSFLNGQPLISAPQTK